MWNRRYIDHVQITVAETVGVETRGGYYDQAGALRDMVPNHIFQLISLTAMEPPGSFEAAKEATPSACSLSVITFRSIPSFARRAKASSASACPCCTVVPGARPWSRKASRVAGGTVLTVSGPTSSSR